MLLASFCACMIIASFLAWRTGNEGRDVGLLGALAGLFGVGSLVSLSL